MQGKNGYAELEIRDYWCAYTIHPKHSFCTALAFGQNSIITRTLAGQIVIEGFLNINFAPWHYYNSSNYMLLRYGSHIIANFVIISQVVLSFKLSFIVVPLIRFTSDGAKMGELVSHTWITPIGMDECMA